MATWLAEPFAGEFVARSQELIIARRGLLPAWTIDCGSFQGQDGKFSSSYHETVIGHSFAEAMSKGVFGKARGVVFHMVCVIDDMQIVICVKCDDGTPLNSTILVLWFGALALDRKPCSPKSKTLRHPVELKLYTKARRTLLDQVRYLLVTALGSQFPVNLRVQGLGPCPEPQIHSNS